MKRRTFLLSAAATLAAPAIRAQAAWPTGQPIRVIVPYPAGAANDAMGRLAAQRLQDKFGHRGRSAEARRAAQEGGI